MSANEQSSTGSSPELATFKEKIRSIHFVGRGKTSNAKKILANQKPEMEAEFSKKESQ